MIKDGCELGRGGQGSVRKAYSLSKGYILAIKKYMAKQPYDEDKLQCN